MLNLNFSRQTSAGKAVLSGLPIMIELSAITGLFVEHDTVSTSYIAETFFDELEARNSCLNYLYEAFHTIDRLLDFRSLEDTGYFRSLYESIWLVLRSFACKVQRSIDWLAATTPEFIWAVLDMVTLAALGAIFAATMIILIGSLCSEGHKVQKESGHNNSHIAPHNSEPTLLGIRSPMAEKHASVKVTVDKWAPRSLTRERRARDLVKASWLDGTISRIHTSTYGLRNHRAKTALQEFDTHTVPQRVIPARLHPYPRPSIVTEQYEELILLPPTPTPAEIIAFTPTELPDPTILILLATTSVSTSITDVDSDAESAEVCDCMLAELGHPQSSLKSLKDIHMHDRIAEASVASGGIMQESDVLRPQPRRTDPSRLFLQLTRSTGVTIAPQLRSERLRAAETPSLSTTRMDSAIPSRRRARQLCAPEPHGLPAHHVASIPPSVGTEGEHLAVYVLIHTICARLVWGLIAEGLSDVLGWIEVLRTKWRAAKTSNIGFFSCYYLTELTRYPSMNMHILLISMNLATPYLSGSSRYL
ncbi:hypothetical protein A0H81_09327 [Grifola frondosa]|uniref:Uncharacterized protein n=1 Tax=Grifola frondosa TaxID=5627 RepID=A0A1C7M172_GRIFR|nr:hypothetical protein A0H81_09327 [Grifola frondosa]